ncbi:MAG: YihA family ribosome biogenesis GTP-binding protein [Clostridia bacterium]|nr:YihA family ribosome biogenesis GTP-binding protein [Clostridia bacterium]
MEINKAEFVTSLDAYGPFPGAGLPQIALAGRSNVGKSSLLNCLTGRKGLAKVSGTPGKTRMINVFLINGTFHLIDLPGYGFAKVSRQEQERWGRMMEDYFASSSTLRLTLHLVDIRHEPTKDDVQMNRFLRESGQPFLTVATKLDKISRAQRMKCLHQIYRTLSIQPWQAVAVSSETGEGKAQLLAEMEKALL